VGSLVVVKEKFGNKIRYILEKKDIQHSELAKECGITRSTFSKLINSGRELDFSTVSKLVRGLDVPYRQEEELMSYYIRDIKNPSNIKQGLEYCDLNDMREMLELLCERAEIKSSHTNMLGEYASIYRLNLARKDQESKKTVSSELFSEIISMNTKTEDMTILKSYLVVAMYYQELNFHKVQDSMKILEYQLENNSNSLLYESLEVRSNQLFQIIKLRLFTDFEELRKLAFYSLERKIGRRFQAASLVRIGLSLSREDPIQAIEYVERGINIYEEMKLGFAVRWMQDKIEFIKISHGMELEIDQIQDAQNMALKHVMDGRKDLGLSILSELEITPKLLFIKGIAFNDPEYHWDSLKGHMKSGDRLSGWYVVQELIKLGEKDDVINLVYNNISSGEVIR